MFCSTVPGALRSGAGASTRLGRPSAPNRPGCFPARPPGGPPGRLRLASPQSSALTGVGNAPGLDAGAVPLPAAVARGCVPVLGETGPAAVAALPGVAAEVACGAALDAAAVLLAGVGTRNSPGSLRSEGTCSCGVAARCGKARAC